MTLAAARIAPVRDETLTGFNHRPLQFCGSSPHNRRNGVAPRGGVPYSLFPRIAMPFTLWADNEVFNRIASGVAVFVCTTAASFVAGKWWGKRQAQRAWRRKQFLGRVVVSLNCFADGWLKIRTIFERSLEEVFLNPVAVQKVRAASQQTTRDAPLLPFAAEDRWFMLNFVLNAVAEQFSGGLVRYDAGGGPTPVTYLLFLTCEVVGEDRIRKVRAMMLRKEVLEDFPYWDSLPKLEQEWHADRIATLRQAAEVYRKEPSHFLPIEVYI
jgi:hypothetical protein